MLVSAQKATIIQQTQRKDMDPTTAAASALYSGLVQNAQNNAVMQTTLDSTSVQASATNQQVIAATAISDNIDEAFAKTRVNLQATEAPAKPAESAAMAAFKDYMSKTPEQRMRDSILEEMGITEDELKAMPPEKQQAIAQEITQRMEEKIKLAKIEKENSSAEKDGSQTQTVDKFLASL